MRCAGAASPENARQEEPILFYGDQLVLPAAQTQRGGCLDGVDAVAALDALQQVSLTGVILGGGDPVDAGLINGHGIQGLRMPMSFMQGSSATAQQSQSTDMLAMTFT